MAPRFHVLYHSDELVVIDKPYDVAMDNVRPDPAEWTVDRWLREVYLPTWVPPPLSTTTNSPCPREPKFVHRLDYATSGVLCVALSRDMASRLGHCFQMRETQKQYVALVLGHLDDDCMGRMDAPAVDVSGVRSASGDASGCPWRCCKAPEDGGTGVFPAVAEESHGAHLDSLEQPSPLWWDVEFAIGYDEGDAQGFRMCIDGKDARHARTRMRILSQGFLRAPPDPSEAAGGTPPRGAALVAATKVLLQPHTGRRHQLRVTCAALGHPIVGDVAYHAAHPSAGIEGATCAVRASDWTRMMLHAWRLAFPVTVESRDGVLALKDRKQRRRALRAHVAALKSTRAPHAEASTGDAPVVVGEEDKLPPVPWTRFEAVDPFSGLLLPATAA